MRNKSRRVLFAAKKFVCDRNRIRTRDANKRDRAFAGGSGNRGDRFVATKKCRSYESAFFSPAMHFSFCSIVPTVMRTHSGKLYPRSGRMMIFMASSFLKTAEPSPTLTKTKLPALGLNFNFI